MVRSAARHTHIPVVMFSPVLIVQALLLEWVPGGSLADFLSKKGLDWNPLLRLTLDIARGMEYLHGRQFYDEESEEYKSVIIHRDLKSESTQHCVVPSSPLCLTFSNVVCLYDPIN